MLRRIRMKPQGERPETIYRKIHAVQPDRTYSKITHSALIRYKKQEVVAYLINGEWVSYGEVQDQDKE